MIERMHRGMVTTAASLRVLRNRIVTVPCTRGLRNPRPAAGCGSERSQGRRFGWQWFGIPAGLGITCLALLQLTRTVRRERRHASSREPETWQLYLFRQLPTRMLSRSWGHITAKDLPRWLRRPLLGLYVWLFDCNMEEAAVRDLQDYSSLQALFTRELKEGARRISSNPLVSPSDGKVLYFGRVQNGSVEQVKGVTYKLETFLGAEPWAGEELAGAKPPSINVEKEVEGTRNVRTVSGELYHIVIYLGPGDCHHFHSPTDWTARVRRHFPGDLLTVAPWAARTMPGLFALNERAVLLGHWEHGFFSFAAVGAYNVGSIRLEVDKELKTNVKGHYQLGEFTDKRLGTDETGLRLTRGDEVGCFHLGSSIVLLFEAPKDFQFLVEPGQRILFGQPLGTFTSR